MTRSLQLHWLLTVSIASIVLTGVAPRVDRHGAAQAALATFGAMGTPAETAAVGTTASKDRKPTAAKVLPFIQDDYATALAKARERKLPLFIEAWAPW